MSMTIGIELNIEQQYYKDRLKVLRLERQGVWTPVRRLPPEWDSNYEDWKPGDTVADGEAIESNRVTPFFTITLVCDGYVWFVDASGKEHMTRETNLYRLQERKA
jgi:hypothetical protein